jgi:hypothetical protein
MTAWLARASLTGPAGCLPRLAFAAWSQGLRVGRGHHHEHAERHAAKLSHAGEQRGLHAVARHEDEARDPRAQDGAQRVAGVDPAHVVPMVAPLTQNRRSVSGNMAPMPSVAGSVQSDDVRNEKKRTVPTWLGRSSMPPTSCASAQLTSSW